MHTGSDRKTHCKLDTNMWVCWCVFSKLKTKNETATFCKYKFTMQIQLTVMAALIYPVIVIRKHGRLKYNIGLESF